MLVVLGLAAGAVVGAPALAGAAPAAPPPDRFAPAGGCWRVGAADGTGAGLGLLAHPLRFVATDLGRYLVVRPDGSLLAADGDGGVLAAAPSEAAEWDLLGPDAAGAFALRTANGARPLTLARDGAVRLPGSGAGTALQLAPASGCAAWPDVGTGVSGPHAQGSSPIEDVRGYLDSHLHLTGYELLGGKVHCGRPWHRYGVAHALVDCPDHEIAGGRVAVLENVLGPDGPVAPHDPVGWPTFRDWPAPDSLTHEQTYHRWVERAWRGGVRMIVQLLVDNRVLCEVYPLKGRSCDEMASVRRQAAGMRAFERYVDAQHGGPGKGWLRIVDDPAEAREVINSGKLAVVLGIEVSEPFGCRAVLDVPLCTAAQVDAQLDELAALGVRQLFLIHKLDNALGGVKGDGGAAGLFTNPGNLLGTGHLLDMRTCGPDQEGSHDNHQELPVYPAGPHCNARGLTALGAHAVHAVADRGLILDVDHMSGLARDAALDLLEQRGYSGVVSSHGWADEDSLPRILELGGVVSPYASRSTGYVRDWAALRPLAPSRFAFGVGFGADSNGLGTQPTPRGGPDGVRYPFTGFGGTTIDRQVSGTRTFDVNVDGVAHYGLYPDWIEDLRLLAGDPILADLERGPEAYLQMWERASGVPRIGDGCLVPGSAARVEPGLPAAEVLRVAGQPQRRTARAFVYCDGEVAFDGQGRATGVRTSGVEATARSLAVVAWDGARRATPAGA